MSDIAEHLRNTTEDMANFASVDMALWDRHSNACLEAADEILRLRAEVDRLRAENINLFARLDKAYSFISRADWMQFFEEEHDAAAALKETGDE